MNFGQNLNRARPQTQNPDELPGLKIGLPLADDGFEYFDTAGTGQFVQKADFVVSEGICPLVLEKREDFS